MKSKFLCLEIIAAAIALVGVIYINNPKLPSVLNMVVLLTYALVCMFISKAYPKPQNPKEKIDYNIHNISWMGLSVMSVGILLSIQHFPGGRTMLFVGLITIAIPLIYHLIKIVKDKDEDEKQDNRQTTEDENELNQKTTVKLIQKWVGDAKYNHTEMLIRLGFALLIAIKLLMTPQVVIYMGLSWVGSNSMVLAFQ